MHTKTIAEHSPHSANCNRKVFCKQNNEVIYAVYSYSAISNSLFHIDGDGCRLNACSFSCERDGARLLASLDNGSERSTKQIHLFALERQQASWVAVGCSKELACASDSEFHQSVVGRH